MISGLMPRLSPSWGSLAPDNSLFWGIRQHVNISKGVNPRDREYQEAYKEFRRRLREARKQAGLTQREVCKLMGKSSSFISKCEMGDRRVDHIETSKARPNLL